jgi:hypothetical protein
VVSVSKNGTINYSQFDEKSGTLIVGYDNFKVSLFKISNTKKVEQIADFNFLKGLLRAANISSNRIQLVTKNAEVYITELNNTTELKPFQLKKKNITSSCTPINDALLLGTEDGEIISLNNGIDHLTLLKINSGSITALKSDKKSNKLFIGTSGGNLLEYDISGQVPKEMSITKISKGAITKLEYDDKLKKCIALSTDKKIIIIDYANKSSNPAFIVNPDIYVRGMMITANGKIITANSDLKLRIYETNMQKMSEEVCASLKRNLTDKEWNKYIGDNFKYKVLNCIK